VYAIVVVAHTRSLISTKKNYIGSARDASASRASLMVVVDVGGSDMAMMVATEG
jgi:hypothetical protein